MLKDELIFDRLAGFSLRTKFEALKKDVVDVESHVRQLNDCLDSLNRMQQRYLKKRNRFIFFINTYISSTTYQQRVSLYILDGELIKLMAFLEQQLFLC